MKCELSGKTIFVTGGSGFVGKSLVCALVDSGARVRVLTRDATRVPSDVRERVQLVVGDLQRVESFRASLAGVNVLVHGARSDHPDAETRARDDIDGTRALLDAAIDEGVSRFVELSSIAVYGITPDGTIDETAPRKPTSDAYARSKVAIEQLVLDRVHQIEAVVLQPANIYGPGGGWWSGSLLQMMRRGRIILVNGGSGIANMIHLSDLAQAVCLSVVSPGIAGASFILTDGRPMTWADYFQRLERLAGAPATISLTTAEAKALSARLSDRRPAARGARWIGRKLLGRPLLFPLSDESVDKYACKTVFSIERAKQLLNYQPRIDLDAGLATLSR